MSVSDGVAADQIKCSGEAEGICSGGDLFLVQMLLYFCVQAIEKHHENFLLAWVSNQAEPLVKFGNVLFCIIRLLPDGMEVSTMLDVCAVQRVFRCPQLFKLFPGGHFLQRGRELRSWAFHKTDDPTKLRG